MIHSCRGPAEFRGRLTRLLLLGFGKAKPDRIGQLAATTALAGRLVRSLDVIARVGVIDEWH